MSTTKGPKVNYSRRNITTRDNLGINAAGTSFQAELCPVINTVTPRAFYWAFAVWNYYDYWQNYKTEKRSIKEFEEDFLKRNDYFFVMATILTPGADMSNLVGIDHCTEDAKRDGPYMYNRKYFKSHYGGMQYYIPGCYTLGFITETDNERNMLPFPKLTEKIGLPIALAFEKTISDTEYYHRYRLADVPVPKPVLEELGKAISLSMKNMEECKQLLRDAFFQPTKTILFNNEKLIQSKDYLLFINEMYGLRNVKSPQMRRILYDYFYPGGEHEKDLPQELRKIASSWEVAVGRQYFALSIELIWKYMLLELTAPMKMETWIGRCLGDSKWSIDIYRPLESVLNKTDFDYEKREKMLSAGFRNSKNVSKNIENALLVMLSLYDRFKDRSDVIEEQLHIGGAISVATMMKKIDDFRNRPISDFLVFLMTDWVIKRHEEVAFRKMIEGRDGFFVEKIDGRYYHRFDSYPDYSGNRMLQLTSVMKDLGMVN